ncbi:MAG: metalloregulator ArsR/SmtB family transcription factor [Thermodesulfovibrio sp.]
MKNLVKIFHALSDETRLKIIKLLSKGELCVCEIVSALNMIQPKVSFHLGVLKEAGLLKMKRKGKWIIYELNDSELFNRFLIISVVEKISDKDIKEELERLKNFKKVKPLDIIRVKVEDKINEGKI